MGIQPKPDGYTDAQWSIMSSSDRYFARNPPNGLTPTQWTKMSYIERYRAHEASTNSIRPDDDWNSYYFS